jgi:hypothetical protein
MEQARNAVREVAILILPKYKKGKQSESNSFFVCKDYYYLLTMTEDKECLPQLQRGGREQSSSFVLPEGTCCSLHICFLLDKQEHYSTITVAWFRIRIQL